MEEFAKKLKDFEPDLLVVGGLQMMDNFPFQSGKRKLVVNVEETVDRPVRSVPSKELFSVVRLVNLLI